MSPTATAVEQVTVACDRCEASFSGPSETQGKPFSKGFQPSAEMKLAMHQGRVHGPASAKTAAPAPRSKKARRSAPRDDNAQPVLALVDAISDEIPRGTKPPTGDELGRAFGKALGIITTTAASYVAETDPTLHTDAERDEVTDYLSLDPRDAADVMAPIGKALSGTALNKRYGRGIVENVDSVAAAAALVKFGLHWRRYLHNREQRLKALTPLDVPHVPVAAPTAAAAGPTAPMAGFVAGATEQAERERMVEGPRPADHEFRGQVITQADVDRIRARNGTA